MDKISIPAEALEAAARVMAEKYCLQYDADPEKIWAHFVEDTRAAALALLEAWPGMHMGHQCTGCGGDPQIILPLATET